MADSNPTSIDDTVIDLFELSEGVQALAYASTLIFEGASLHRMEKAQLKHLSHLVGMTLTEIGRVLEKLKVLDQQVFDLQQKGATA